VTASALRIRLKTRRSKETPLYNDLMIVVSPPVGLTIIHRIQPIALASQNSVQMTVSAPKIQKRPTDKK